MSVLHKPRYRAILILALAAVAMSMLAWIAWNDPAINFLSRDRDAEWIVFPTAVDARGHVFASLDATFRREFVLNNQPATAGLSVRAVRRADVKINGVLVLSLASRNWKGNTSINIAEQLHAGTNVVEARVFNDNGPPVLWLNLTTDQLDLRSDKTWEASIVGSSWHRVALASTARIPDRGNSIAGGTHTLDATKKSWPFWIVLFAIASVITVVWRLTVKQTAALPLEQMVLVLLAGLWLLLFWNNARLLPFHAGFDSKEHLKYIDYIQEHRTLPLPTEGWEMYQPPLYYLIAAGTLSACKVCLRLLLPLRTALVGLLLAAFLPMHLYLAHYVTNEMLAAVLATLTLYLCLHLLRSETPRVAQFAWLGLALGAAILAKATGILLLPIVTVVIIGKLAYARTPIAISVRNIGLLLVSCFAVCGWHYARIWVKFGTPLLGNWDAMSGFRWWQDPGYHTVADYFRFGRSLVNPLFSSFAGFCDGIYSTLWGDGLCGGLASLTLPWNEHPMLTGYLWALIPTVLILAGVVVALVRFVRRPSSELFLLLGFSAVILLALVFMTLKVPSYAQAKAFYGLSVLTPLCFFGPLGWQTLTTGHARLRLILGVLVLVWAMNSFATYWIIPSAPQHLYAAKTLGNTGKINRAAAEAMKAVEADPTDAAARGFHALSLSELGQDEEAIKEAERAIELSPSNSVAHLQLAISVKRTDMERAIEEARRAIDFGPENSSAYQFLMNCLLESHRYNEATAVGRQWLTVSPYEVAPHSALAAALAEAGDLGSAAQQLGYVMILRPEFEQARAQLRQLLLSLTKQPDGMQRLRDIAANAPDSPRMLDELAWLLSRVASRTCSVSAKTGVSDCQVPRANVCAYFARTRKVPATLFARGRRLIIIGSPRYGSALRMRVSR